MKDINHHLNNIKRNYHNLLELGKFLQKSDYEKLSNSLEEKHNNYTTAYKEIFDPQKRIKEDMVYFADVRTLAKYNEDIVSGWLVEDFFFYLFNLQIFKKHDFIFSIDSHDCDRVIKKERTFINSDPDFTVIHNGIKFKLEIQSLLIPYGKFHIKQNKASRLFTMTSFLYCLLLAKKEIVFFNPTDIKNYGKLTKIKAFGGKDGYEYIIDNLPKNKILSNSGLDKKLLVTLYWFYYYKKLGDEKFEKFRDKVIGESNSIDGLLEILKNEKEPLKSKYINRFKRFIKFTLQ